jgi:hypothetical protein
MTNPFAGLIRFIRSRGTGGEFMTLDCRDENHSACDACKCSCHGGFIALRTDGHPHADI